MMLSFITGDPCADGNDDDVPVIDLDPNNEQAVDAADDQLLLQ